MLNTQVVAIPDSDLHVFGYCYIPVSPHRRVRHICVCFIESNGINWSFFLERLGKVWHNWWGFSSAKSNANERICYKVWQCGTGSTKTWYGWERYKVLSLSFFFFFKKKSPRLHTNRSWINVEHTPCESQSMHLDDPYSSLQNLSRHAPQQISCWECCRSQANR